MVVADMKYANCGKELVHNYISKNDGTPVDVSECQGNCTQVTYVLWV